MQYKRRLTLAVVVAALSSPLVAQVAGVNAGGETPNTIRPFVARAVAEFNMPWAKAFLPDGRLLVTEKAGGISLVGQDGRIVKVGNVPVPERGSLLDIAVAPGFRTSSEIYFTYVEESAGQRLVLARATLAMTKGEARLEKRVVLWRQTPSGGHTHTGGIIAFDPQGAHLFLTTGDMQEPSSAQDPSQARGKVLRLSLDGSVPSDNPHASRGGVVAQTWTTGHRNPYGLAFAPDGRLWLHEMGPRGGDELNLIKPAQNYGWPVVSNGSQYSGAPIPDHHTRPEFSAPHVYWTPVISPSGLAFYQGAMFLQWRGSALIGGLSSQSLVRVSFGRDGLPNRTERWDMGARIRDVSVAPDGAVWIIEDGNPGRLLRLTPRPPGRT
jgi:glucose/arabinose dehydrogenase